MGRKHNLRRRVKTFLVALYLITNIVIFVLVSTYSRYQGSQCWSCVIRWTCFHVQLLSFISLSTDQVYFSLPFSPFSSWSAGPVLIIHFLIHWSSLCLFWSSSPLSSWYPLHRNPWGESCYINQREINKELVLISFCVFFNYLKTHVCRKIK